MKPLTLILNVLLLVTSVQTFAIFNAANVEINDHRIDYYLAEKLAFKLADLAEEMSYNPMSFSENHVNDHRDVRYLAERLHQEASDLYYLLRRFNYQNRALDHREDRVRDAFYDVRNAYYRLKRVAYGYKMRRITGVYNRLSDAIFGR